MRIVRCCAAVGVLVVMSGVARAQDTTPRAAPSPSAMAVAEELLGLMNTEQVLRAAVAASVNAQVKAQPLLAPFLDVMNAWVEKVLTMKAIEPALARAYAELFTEAEIHQLTAFYRTPLGRRLAAVSPELTRRSAEVGSAVAEAHSAELREMIAKRPAEIQSESPPP
jgi:hypothetical protein